VQSISKISDQKVLDIIYESVYSKFIEPLDGIDNGINQYDTQAQPRYSMQFILFQS
jgi:uncharacterized UPF0160 family protein